MTNKSTVDPDGGPIFYDGDDRYSAYELDTQLREKAPHGVEGHLGWRCKECAMLAAVVVFAEPLGPDHWQNKQIAWQEECDVVMVAFDASVAAHFPVHLPQNCNTCPVKPILPPKPVAPVERVTAQKARS